VLANNKNIADLEFDLSDGLRLIALVEVLSGKKFAKLNRRPNFRTQKLENVTMCLRFLEEDEGIKIVNIGMCCSSAPVVGCSVFERSSKYCVSVCLSVYLSLCICMSVLSHMGHCFVVRYCSKSSRHRCRKTRRFQKPRVRKL